MNRNNPSERAASFASADSLWLSAVPDYNDVIICAASVKKLSLRHALGLQTCKMA